MVGQLSSLVGGEVGTRVYDLLNRVQLWRICAVFFSGSLPPVYVLPDRVLANPRATARVPTSLHHRSRPYKDTARFASSCLMRIGEEVVPSLF